jgi:hypothetical protein
MTASRRAPSPAGSNLSPAAAKPSRDRVRAMLHLSGRTRRRPREPERGSQARTQEAQTWV